MKTKEDKVSPYTILNRWLYDGSRSTKLPNELVDDSVIGQNFLLYYFQQSPYGLVISKLFNNFGIYSLEKEEVFKFAKDCIILSGYKPKFFQKESHTKQKIEKILKTKFPYLKNYEILTLIEFIDKDENKDTIYEMFGIYDPKKKKTTKADLKKFDTSDAPVIIEKVTLQNIMEKFTI